MVCLVSSTYPLPSLSHHPLSFSPTSLLSAPFPPQITHYRSWVGLPPNHCFLLCFQPVLLERFQTLSCSPFPGQKAQLLGIKGSNAESKCQKRTRQCEAQQRTQVRKRARTEHLGGSRVEGAVGGEGKGMSESR